MDTSQKINRLVQRVLRVNHAGEQGAISIYGAQISRARHSYPDLLQWLEETLEHEKRHRSTFLELMSTRDTVPCPVVSVWSIGGACLGAVTGLFGRSGVLVCTAAVERTVHKHLIHQIAYLSGRDDELADCIRRIQLEENTHLAFAEAHHDPRALFARWLSSVVAIVTEILIWIATRGDSSRLSAELRKMQNA